MLPKDNLKDLLNQAEYSRGEKLLMCLAVDAGSAKQVRDVKEIAKNAGLRAVDRWNVSQILGATKGLAVRTDQGWELSGQGRRRVSELAGPLASAVVPKVASSLRHYLGTISNADTKAFVEEAVECLEGRHLRAAVVLSWVGAVAVLYDFVVAERLPEFNTEAKRRDPKWKMASNADDLSLLKEYTFLQVLQTISVIGKNVKQELEGCLRLRNGCGHPNSFVIGENRAAAHVETLVHNIFAKF